MIKTLMKLFWTDWMINIKKGEIYLANLGNTKKEDIGKVRPILVFQNNFLNRMLKDSLYKDVVIIPISSQIIFNDFTLFVPKRDKLEKDSIVVCNAIKMIKADRIKIQSGILTKLNNDEILKIENILYNLFDCKIKGR